MSRASRRKGQISSNLDDAKSSIVGLSGWLFADLLLALAVVFLVASDRPSVSSAVDPSDKFDISVEFSTSKNGEPISEIEVFDESFDIWIQFSEPVFSNSFTESDLLLEPEDEWSVRFVDKPDSGSEKSFLVRLNPENVKGTKLVFTVEQGAARGAESDNSYNAKATLAVSITICRTLSGIAVSPEETSRFIVKGGAKMSESQLQDWLQNSELEELPRTHPIGSEDFGFGTAKLIFIELQKPIDQRRQVGFAILFGGYNRGSETAKIGATRAKNMEDEVRNVLRDLGLLSGDNSNVVQGACPLVFEIPLRPFGDGEVSKDDLKFELYFYENE